MAEQKVALVTGVSSGIGLATVTRLSELVKFAPQGILDKGLRKQFGLETA